MRGLLDIASVGKNPLDFRNMDEQTLRAAVSVLFHGGKDLPVTELDLAQLRSVDLALMDGASPAEAMRAAEKPAPAEPEAPAASLASEARDVLAARTKLDRNRWGLKKKLPSAKKPRPPSLTGAPFRKEDAYGT